MIDHIWTVLCSRAVVDNQSNNISLQNVIEQIAVLEVPQPESRLAWPIMVASLWTRTDPDVGAQGTARLTHVSPSGQPLDQIEIEVKLDEYKRLRTRLTLAEIAIPKVGRYHFRMELQLAGSDEWRQVADIPLTVIVRPPPEATEDAPTDSP